MRTKYAHDKQTIKCNTEISDHPCRVALFGVFVIVIVVGNLNPWLYSSYRFFSFSPYSACVSVCIKYIWPFNIASNVMPSSETDKMRSILKNTLLHAAMRNKNKHWNEITLSVHISTLRDIQDIFSFSLHHENDSYELFIHHIRWWMVWLAAHMPWEWRCVFLRAWWLYLLEDGNGSE